MSFALAPAPALSALMIGGAAGLHAATWGMYKDCLYEGFAWGKYFRSVWLAMLLALGIQLLRPLPFTPAGLLLLFALTYVLERAVTEWVKGFVRREDQAKYFIPMRFAVFGRPVRGEAGRLVVGLAYAGGLAGAVAVIASMQPLYVERGWVFGLLVAWCAGGISALGGAWKDAPLEGFDLFKFFRSPAIAGAWGGVLALLSDDLVAVAFGGLGLSIATIETWKKFRARDEAPGKFSGKPIRFPELRVWRDRVVPVYAGLWSLLILLLLVALTTPRIA